MDRETGGGFDGQGSGQVESEEGGLGEREGG